jgi:Putative MetA-pathway of phenol degradation
MVSITAIVQAFIALLAFNLAMILAPVSAMADPPDASADQQVAGSQDTTPQSLRVNNGFDLTRPQTALEVRPSDQTSSTDTSKTNQAQMLFRVESKIPLDVDWRLGLLAEVPIVGETTTNFNPPSVTHEFGLGDMVFQVFVAHDINERWAVAVGARVSAQTAADSLGSGEWQTMLGLGVRYMLFELGPDSYFVPTMRWALSTPTNPGARRISEPQIAPTLNIDLPGEQRYPHQLRRSGNGPDRTAVSPLRCFDRRATKRQGANLVRGECADRQRISRL